MERGFSYQYEIRQPPVDVPVQFIEHGLNSSIQLCNAYLKLRRLVELFRIPLEIKTA